MIKAVGLFSGGLDSLLAIKVMQEQGIDVIAVSFCSPFFIANDEKKKKLEKTADEQGFKIIFIELRYDYLGLVRNPPHGHGKNINPCIDCHAFMIKKAKEYADGIGAKFVFTGEVLDERPMSQNRRSLDIVAQDSGLSGKLLRPLSAKLLPETEAEKKGYVDRNKLLDLHGRQRKQQFELAKKFKIKEHETPGGGCLLTQGEYAKKLKDYFAHSNENDYNEIMLLKVGRHFRLGANKIIVGRNQKDNEEIEKLAKESDYLFQAKDIATPTTLLSGEANDKAILVAAQLTARYSDADTDEVYVKYWNANINKELKVKKIEQKEINKLMI